MCCMSGGHIHEIIWSVAMYVIPQHHVYMLKTQLDDLPLGLISQAPHVRWARTPTARCSQFAAPQQRVDLF